MNSHVTIGGGNNPFAALSSIVLGEEPLPVILERVVHLAKEVIPAPVETSITLIGADGPETVGFSGEPAITLDERQYESERGPCLDAASSGNRILITDMTAESRWPQFAQAAVNSAVRSSLSVPLPVQREVTARSTSTPPNATRSTTRPSASPRRSPATPPLPLRTRGCSRRRPHSRSR